jgi:hypothetical protein
MEAASGAMAAFSVFFFIISTAMLVISIAAIVVFFKLASRVKAIYTILDAWRNSGVPTRQRREVDDV